MKQILITAMLALGCMSANAQSNATYSDGVLTVNGVRYEFAMVEAGTFTMGATDEQADFAGSNEKPAHKVTLTNDYFMGKTEVTQALWAAVMGDGDHSTYFVGDNKPVDGLSWERCQEFISKLNSLTGENFRLPTEAEWEFAARGGNSSRHYVYSGSDNPDEVGWYKDNSHKTTHDVATKKPNELGIYDMSGNVCEWCQDWYGVYSSNAQSDPTGPTDGDNRVARGGRWMGGANGCRTSYRGRFNPYFGFNFTGFRLCISSEAKAQTGSSSAKQASSPAKGQANYQLTIEGVSYEFVKVEAGTFTMGATEEMKADASTSEWEASAMYYLIEDESPTHQVTLTKDYYIGKTEVTQALWTAVMGDNPSDFKGDNKPVEMVTWNECHHFIKKLNSLTGKNFRLPTEAEWEYAARGGNKSKHYKYSGSSNLDDVGWYNDESGDKTTHDVATKQPNELGIYDMSGNVSEWCQDWHVDYSGNAQTDPAGPSTTPEWAERVLRGGAWDEYARSCRSSARSNLDPDNGLSSTGLRLVISE